MRRGPEIRPEIEDNRPELTPPEIPGVPLSEIMKKLGTMPPTTAVLGMAHDGRPCLLRLRSQAVKSVLVAGEGKVELLKAMVASLVMQQTKDNIKIFTFGSLRHDATLGKLPHVDTETSLEDLVRLMGERDGDQKQSFVVVTDRMEDREKLTQLINEGFEHDVHLLVGVEEAELQNLNGMQFTVKILGRMPNSEIARSITGMRYSGAEKLNRGMDFLAIAGGGAMRFTGAYLDSSMELPR